MQLVIFIIVQFILDKQDDQDGDCQACSQAKDVYGGVILSLTRLRRVVLIKFRNMCNSSNTL